jgi:hypothetical protein
MRPRVLALTVAGGAAAAVAVALVRMRPAGLRAALPSVPALPRRQASDGAAAEPETFRCDCGQEFRVSGTGRHRVYWLAGAGEDDPVLSPQCPSCDRPLPRDSETTAAQVSVTRGA